MATTLTAEDNNNEQQQQKKRIAAISRVATIANMIPREIFNSEEDWFKEIDKVMGYKGMSDDDIKAYYDSRRIVQQTQSKRVKVKSANVSTDNKDNGDNNDIDNDRFELPDWIPKVSDFGKIPYQIKSASVYSNSFPVPDISHSVIMCVSRERRNAEELTEFLSMFEGLVVH
jgi:hypothetical protein